MLALVARLSWKAGTEYEWNRSYPQRLARWDGQGYLQGEFGKVRTGIVMDLRVGRWLEETDEFGIIMIAIREFPSHQALVTY